jgi:hypothetical protein
VFSNPDLSMLNSNFSAFEENANEEDDERAKRIVSDFFCLLVKTAAELAVKNITHEGTLRQLELLSKIHWHINNDSLSSHKQIFGFSFLHLNIFVKFVYSKLILISGNLDKFHKYF